MTTGPWAWNLVRCALPLVIALLFVWILYEDEASNLKRKFDLKQAHFASGGTSDKTNLSEPLLPLELVWKNATQSMPFEFSKPPYIVEIKDKVYIGGGESSSQFESVVMVYDLEKDMWSKLPPYPHKLFALTVLNDSLVVVGGVDKNSGKRTSMISYWNNYSKTWSFPFPSMRTACSVPTVTTYDNRFLVIAGGRDDEQKLSRVDILDTVHSKWYTAAPHPAKHTHMSSVTVGNMWYLMSGFTKSAKGASKRAFSVCLDDLTYKAMYSHSDRDSPWQILHDTPLKRSTALAIDGALLALGGNGTTIIHMYKPSSDIWEHAAEMPTSAGKSCVYQSISNNSKIFAACYTN